MRRCRISNYIPAFSHSRILAFSHSRIPAFSHSLILSFSHSLILSFKNIVAIEQIIHTNGKLLLTGEYFVLDGALSLGLPVRFGQQLKAGPALGSTEHQWVSLGFDGLPWFEGRFSPVGVYQGGSDAGVGERLEGLFQAIEQQRPGFWMRKEMLRFETRLSFPREWGLGSSSTLIAALGQWAKVDPFQLLAKTFGGSGYDIACALARQPILFQRRDGVPHYVDYPFRPPFADYMCFVYLKRKQDSWEGIARYRKIVKETPGLLGRVSALTVRFLQARSAEAAIRILQEHEELVGKALQLPKVKDALFPEFPGAVKSLGAWGGDFAMAISTQPGEVTRQYLRGKGYETVFTWGEMALQA